MLISNVDWLTVVCMTNCTVLSVWTTAIIANEREFGEWHLARKKKGDVKSLIFLFIFCLFANLVKLDWSCLLLSCVCAYGSVCIMCVMCALVDAISVV